MLPLGRFHQRFAKREQHLVVLHHARVILQIGYIGGVSE
ncbi:hypothetical protein ALPO108162_00785 [Alicyclobacillus pomorum]